MLMGVRSRLVLEKLGHDLRGYYAELLTAPVPPELVAVLDRSPSRPHRLPNVADGPTISRRHRPGSRGARSVLEGGEPFHSGRAPSNPWHSRCSASPSPPAS